MTNTISRQTSGNNTLPEGWAWTTLGATVDQLSNGLTKRQSKEPVGVPVSRIQTISQGTINLDLVGYLPDVSTKEVEKYKLRSGDILFSHINSDLHLGKTALFTLDDALLLHGMNLLLIRANTGLILPPLMHYLFNHLRFSGYFMSIAQHAVNQSSINQAKMKAIPIPLPPLNEQRRIVEKIEELFTKLDAGVRSLEQARSQLKSYRRSVLKAAVEGELSREWHEAHRDELEPASELLDRILQERREKFAGKKYKEPASPDTSDLPALPDGWEWANFERLAQAKSHALKAGPFGSALKKSYYVPHGYKIYGQEQVLRGDAHYGDYYIDEQRYRDLESCKVAPGDILVSLVGTIGQVLILPENIEPGIINPRLVKLSLDGRLVKPRYIKILLAAPVIREYFAISAHGGTMDILNLSILKQLPIPLPAPQEQLFIVEEVERRLSVVDKLEATVEENLKQAAGLRQSILKQAFSGELVPQDPDDEPASVLLVRIREEREATKQKAKRPRKVRKDDEAQGRLI